MPRNMKRKHAGGAKRFTKNYKHQKGKRNFAQPQVENNKFKKFKHIQRNKESEDALRRLKEVESVRHVRREESSSEEDEGLNSDEGEEIEEESGTEEESDSDDDLPEDTILRPEESTRKTKSVEVLEDDFEDNVEEESEEEEFDEETEKSMVNPDSLDMFSVHLNNELSPDLLECVHTTHVSNTHELDWKVLGRLIVDIPTTNDERPAKKAKKNLLGEDECFASEGQVPERINHKSVDMKKLFIKSQIEQNIVQANQAHLAKKNSESTLTSLQAELASIMFNYQDLYCPHRTHENGEEIRFTYCLHALNHLMKTRTKILHHNAKLGKSAASNVPAILPDAYRDQGLFRPKVLIMVPFRESGLRVVKTLISLIYPDTGAKVMHYKRFLDEFGGEGLFFPKTNPKPEDYEQTFAGNSDDTFRVGISFTRNCMKLFSDFYTSDLLIASPLGLRMIVGAPGDKERDYDFLASIELLILDQADLFLAQNWDHLLHVLDHLHLQPKSARNTDFSRVRPWCLNGWARFYRQTLLFTSHELPEFRSLFNSRCANYRGKVRVANPIITGSIHHVAVQIPQTFHRIDVTSIQNSFDERFHNFINRILPQFKSATMAHCMVFVPSYFDFVRLRNYFKKETMNFVQICEYSKDTKIARARDMFFHSGAHFMLYSERAHFFRRTRIKGIRHLIMYQPPTWPHFYPELINLMQDAYQNPRDGGDDSMTVTVLYTKYDMLQISAIVGSERAQKMATSEKTTQIFMTGE
ncbi:U3 small nucleolar RNA-associated protein 25 like [Pseudolycoriella hygida]|uniref:U3 small nucleolar RNA-associated protein 25 homolog n=1 Tax=Pseudolycoriella hygida TaxID=35572 RepID=A0A9Q0MWI3_9DIPT|nr:U3 small nucleolar RNA-associated protein 25 like [Pseudolycoriella hygida]